MLDLRTVAAGLGYHGHGLKRLTQHVLGVSLPKVRAVTMSNWEARTLTRNQIKYAALDVLVAGQVYRGLRLWHSSPSPCEACRVPLGGVSAAVSAQRFMCGEQGCARAFTDVRAYLTHCQTAGHAPRWALCDACGRMHTLEVGAPEL